MFKDQQIQFENSLILLPLLTILRRLERFEYLFRRLEQRGVIHPDDLLFADLQSSLAHAERIGKIRSETSLPCEDIDQAAATVRAAITALEQRAI